MFFLLAFSLVLVATLSNAVLAQQGSWKIHAGLTSLPLQTSGFDDFHISDWERYGLKILNSSSAEGRVSVPLSSFQGSNLTVGIGAGLYYGLTDGIDAGADFQFGFGSANTFTFLLGTDLKLINGDKFKLGIMPKIGYASVSANVGTISLIRGYTNPVIITEGTFGNGDNLKVKIGGFATQVALTPSFSLSDKIDLRTQIGYNFSFLGKAQIKATKAGSTDSTQDGITINLESPAVVKTDGRNTQANVSPEAQVRGLTFSIGIVYKF